MSNDLDLSEDRDFTLITVKKNLSITPFLISCTQNLPSKYSLDRKWPTHWILSNVLKRLGRKNTFRHFTSIIMGGKS